MPIYEWKDENGNIGISNKHDVPPDNNKKWERIFSFGISSINGAGGSPSRPPLTEKKPNLNR